MDDSAKPSDEPRAPFENVAFLESAWGRFRSGEAVPCPRDEATFALSVDGAVGAYRFVCTRCGLASPWFESGSGGVRVRAHTHEGEHGGASGA